MTEQTALGALILKLAKSEEWQRGSASGVVGLILGPLRPLALEAVGAHRCLLKFSAERAFLLGFTMPAPGRVWVVPAERPEEGE
jgi:hypothetical protein